MVTRFINSNIALLCLAALAISLVYHGEQSDATVAIRGCEAGAVRNAPR
jgi:hypothetical protein